MRSSLAFTLATALATANAQLRGFNYGSTFTTGAAKGQSDFEAEFSAAQNLSGASGFTSARLYTMIQGGTTNTPILAIPAAITTNTSLLLGLWASAGAADFNNEIAALNTAISQYGTAFTDLIVGISVGSEDLYRISPTGIENKSGAGAQPVELVAYITQVRDAIEGTAANGTLIGHVDTWTAYVNGSNNALITACDFLGVDAYPYFQTTMANSITNGNATFFDAYDATLAVSQGKPVWVTETGWPVSGPQENEAVASVANAKTYWSETACTLLGNINTYWYTLQDAEPDTPSPSFGLLPAGDLTTVSPLFDLTCPAGTSGAKQSSSRTMSSSAKLGSSSTLIHATSSVRLTTATIATSTTSGSLTSKATPMNSIQSANPTELLGTFEFPHLIVPISKSQPQNAFGTSYSGVVSPNVSSIFNFDFPASYAGKTCNLVFIFPDESQQRRLAATVKTPGGINVQELATPASTSTTYANTSSGKLVGSVEHLEAGHGYTISSGACAAGKTLGYRVDSANGLDLEFFQSITPALGLFVTVS